MFDHPVLIGIGFFIACWLYAKLAGAGSSSKRVGGDTDDEWARRNTSTDINYQGWRDHGSDRDR